MRVFRLGLVIVSALCGALPACTAADIGPGMGGGGSAPVPPSHATVRFKATGTLAVSPGSTHDLGVIGEPAAAYQIGFTLLGEPLDGWLDPPETTASASGHASVQLHAPSQATTFHVRASLLDAEGAPGASADRAVAVSDQGFGSIRVEPMYGGHRPVVEWTASVVVIASCADLAATLPEEPAGALTATAPASGMPVIENAPVGPNLAVVVRAGHFAWGCTNTAALTPGGTMSVPVNVIDKPLTLAGASLPTTFDFAGAGSVLAPIHAGVTAILAEAFLPSGGKDGSVILNAMAALVPASSAAAFSTQRIDKGWDGIAATHFAKLAPGLRERLALWATAGLTAQSPSISALLASGNPGPATATVTRFGDLEAAAAGAAKSVPLTWSAEPQDKVLLSADLSWEPTRFAGNAALAPAQEDVPGAASMPEALASIADCSGLGDALGGFGTCDAGCIEQLCAAALGARFSAALGASQKASQLGTLAIKASADATVGDTALPTGLAGHWIGELSLGATTVTLTGALTAPAP